MVSLKTHQRSQTSYLCFLILQVFQRRVDGSTDFYLGRQNYEDGFGDLTGNFWLGNGLVSSLTSTGQWQLRVDLTDWEGGVAYAQYDVFSIGAAPGFRLTVGGYSGNAGHYP